MNGPPKQKPECEEGKPDDPTWEKDQQERGYYYDDAHGYERYDPEKDVDEGETKL